MIGYHNSTLSIRSSIRSLFDHLECMATRYRHGATNQLGSLLGNTYLAVQIALSFLTHHHFDRIHIEIGTGDHLVSDDASIHLVDAHVGNQTLHDCRPFAGKIRFVFPNLETSGNAADLHPQ